jgi:rRNA maturation endonuclease Nob1
VSTLLRIKRLLTRSGDGQYVCLACRARFDRQYQVCPECGGYDIRRTEWLDADETRPPEKRA